MPIREYQCRYCGHEFEEFITSTDPDVYRYYECRCGSKAEVLPSSIAGVNGVSLSSARPKTRTSTKPYRDKPGSADEPQIEEKKKQEIEEQLELEFGDFAHHLTEPGKTYE